MVSFKFFLWNVFNARARIFLAPFVHLKPFAEAVFREMTFYVTLRIRFVLFTTYWEFPKELGMGFG